MRIDCLDARPLEESNEEPRGEDFRHCDELFGLRTRAGTVFDTGTVKVCLYLVPGLVMLSFGLRRLGSYEQ